MRWIALLGAVAACATWLFFIPWNRVVTGENDFLGQYCGAKLAGTPQLHDPQACQLEQVHAVGVSIPTIVFIRPDYYAVMLRPLAWMPFRWAYIVFTLINAAAMALALYLVRGRKDVLVLGLVSIPVITSFVNGQDVPLVLAALLGAVALDRKGYSFLGGLVLALCAIKPHLFVFVPVALIAGRRWRMIAGGVAGMAIFFVAAALMQGWNWIVPFVDMLRIPGIHKIPFPLPNLRGLATALPAYDGVIEWTGTILVFAWLVYTCIRSKPDQFEHLVAMSMAASLLVSHHLGPHDCMLLLAVAAFASVESRSYKVAVLLAAPISYFVALMASPISAIPALALAGGFFSTSPKPVPVPAAT
ncbi:MAG TPA: glycosyltransferase family 87 protein [Bryobacteraceae bacterium]|jgi:hypothetical protein